LDFALDASLDDRDFEADPHGHEGFETVVEHMYKPRESVFGAVAADMVKAGWSVFPQEMDGNRRPGKVNGEMIKWSEEHHLATRQPSPETIALWSAQCASLNVAVVLGPASGNTFIIDIDVVEEELSAHIQELAERMLGHTPLRRVGRYPKMALVYRHAPEDEVPGRSPKFAPFDTPDNPDKVDQGLEIISAGQAMTFFGKHHKTGRYFTWLEGQPHILGPKTAPIVTSQQVNDFLDAVDSVRQFHKSASFDPTAVSWEWNETDQIHVPRVRSSGAATDWIEDENGRVVDGREAYMTRLAYRAVTANAGVATKPGASRTELVVNREGCEKLTHIVMQQFIETAETSGRWKGNSLLREARSKVMRTAEKLAKGQIKAFTPRQNEKGEYVPPSVMRYIPPQPRKAGVDSLDFLPPAADPTAPGFDPNAGKVRKPLKCVIVEPAEGAQEERAIEEDRTRVAGAVQEGLVKAFREFWDEVYSDDGQANRVHILKAPTGAGKTSRGIAFIAEDPRTKDDYVIRGPDGQIVHEGRCPILFLLPTYANIEELRSRAKMLNLDASLGDDALRAQASEMGLIQEDDLPAKLAELRRDARNAGLTTMVYQGKLKAGCLIADKLKIAMDAGIGTSGLCKAEVRTGEKDENGKWITETRFCEFYNQCPAILQKEEIAKSHVVFMPHAFLSLNVPEELKYVRAVVADERIHHLFLHTTTLDLPVFLSPRKPPKLSKKEKEEGVDPSEFLPMRGEAVKVALAALVTGKCPAEELLRVPGHDAEGRPVALSWVEAALRTCGAAMQRDGNITPDISMEDLKAICQQPTGVQVREEHRFWTIVKERMEARRFEVVNEDLAKADPTLAVPATSKGSRDMRIQLVEDPRDSGEPHQMIRLSWRTEPNWVDRPLLLLDASAAPEMISKIWKGKDVVVHDIPAALNVRVVCIADRTYSNASVVASPSASGREKLESGRMLTAVRKAICTISAMYGWSRVVAGGSILVRRAVNTGWEGPHNVDWCHYGAMRGLDFAKHHAAAISVGRMELPVRTIDGLVAALTYDDDDPEQPYDLKGNGIGKDNQPLRIPVGTQRIRLRSGHDVEMPVPMFPGKWGRMIQKQYREEELLQFLGRLRPVYREGDAPIWFSLSSVIPEEVIVDDLIKIEDLLSTGTHVWDALRRCQGILEPRLAAMVCDDMFASPSAAAAAMRMAGADPRTGEVNARLAWGLTCWKWESADGAKGHAFIRADIDDPEQALRNAFKSYMGTPLLKAERISQSKGQTMARGRKADKIEDELGTLPERREKEVELADETAMDILMSAQPEDLEHLRGLAQRGLAALPAHLPSGVHDERIQEGARDIPVQIDVAEARLAIAHLWRSKGYEEAPAAAAVPASLDSDAELGVKAAVMHANGEGDEPTYEKAAAHAKDTSGEAAIEFDELDDTIPW